MNFKQHRVSNNLTQEQVAQDVGVQRTTVAMWESGKSRPRAELLPKLAKLFGWRFLCDWKGRLFLNKPVRRGILWVR